ncbi:hypothetical protein Plhal304r1_c010g0040751 [Plasmopara halstedii]
MSIVHVIEFVKGSSVFRNLVIEQENVMWASTIFEVSSAAYELASVVTDVILNYEYINRKWLEEYILSIVFLGVNGIVMGLVGLCIDHGYPNRFFYNKLINRVFGFCIGLLQMRVFIETIYTAILTLKSGKANKFVQRGENSTENADNSHVVTVGGHVVNDALREKARQELLCLTFIQAIVRDVPLFVLQANATIHYRKWRLIDLFTVITTFISLSYGIAAFIAKEDGNCMKFFAFVFLVGQFVFRLGAILLLAMTKGFAILVYGIVIILFAILWTAKLRLAYPSFRLIDQLPRAMIFFPLFTLFVIDGTRLTAEYGSAVSALQSKKLVLLHLWRCLENIVGMVLAIILPRYTDFGVSSDATVLFIGGICLGIYLILAYVFYCAPNRCTKRNSDDTERILSESPYTMGLN